ncbi:maltose/maltodextrin ABC transporter ATP-binding protein, partial [Pseudomonas syringae pv. actinidiae ICMP 18804]
VALQLDDSNLHMFDADGLALKRHADAGQQLTPGTTPHLVQAGTL